MNNVGVAAFGAGRGDFGFVSTDMTRENITVGMETHGEKTIRAKSLPAAFFTNCKRRRTAAIMKNESLMLILKTFFDSCQHSLGEIAIFNEIIAIFEIDDGSFGFDGILFVFGG